MKINAQKLEGGADLVYMYIVILIGNWLSMSVASPNSSASEESPRILCVTNNLAISSSLLSLSILSFRKNSWTAA